MTANEDRGNARRTQIFKAAAAVFARQGYHRARMDDIVEESGLSKGALYWYFKSKEELATGLVHQMLTHESEALEAVVSRPEPAADRLRFMSATFARDLTESPEKASLTLELLALARTVPEIRECFSSHHEHFVDQISRLLAELRGTRPSSAETRTAALALSALIDGMVLRWALATQPFDLESALRETIDALVQDANTPGK
ncbi:TetR/AcrR family transcriptional regulator [Streptomyces sp. NPDC048172]|uniref:TetR/AcrR family transcriptional regulator n=1 Tax=Streptomyces sp. NPDC048172 TaxID=3365505 RepID=UPI003714E2ED